MLFLSAQSFIFQMTTKAPVATVAVMKSGQHNSDTLSREQANSLMRWATRASVCVAALLVVGKAIVWWMSGSVALLGSLADSGLDLAASLVTLFAIKTAVMPPDAEHRFGHGKAEALAGLFQATLMGGSAVFLLLQSVERLFDPQPVSAPATIIQVSIVAIGLSLVLVLFQAYVVRKTRSLAIAGDHLHYKGDLLLNLGVIVAAYAVGEGVPQADPLIGIAIAFYILFGALGIARPATNMLMDREFDIADRERIFNLVLESKAVRGLHELKTRAAGRDRFIQMHIEVDGDLTVREAHFIAHEVEATVGEAFPDTEIIIHVDPPSEKSLDLTLKELPEQKDI